MSASDGVTAEEAGRQRSPGWGIGPFSNLFDLVMMLGHMGLHSWRLEAELSGGQRQRFQWDPDQCRMVRESPST